MATVERENIGLLNDKITIKLSKEDYFPTFEKKLKEYSKKINMPGFRKGMVPTGMIKKMYGPSLYTDEILKTVEKQLHTYLDTEKPDIFAQPLPLEADMRKLDVNNPAEYEFGFEIGLKPAFEIAPLDSANVIFHKVMVTDEMVEDEISRMQIKSGVMTEQESISNDEDVLNLLFLECDEIGQVKQEGIQKEISVILKDLTPAGQEELKGRKKDELVISVQLSKFFDGDNLENVLQDLGFEKTDEAAADNFFQVRIQKIELVEKKEFNEAFFNEVFPGGSITSAEEFRKKLKEEIEQYWDDQSRNQMQDQVYHYLLDETNIEFPAEFLKRWLQTGSEEHKTAEQAEKEFPFFSGQLKWTLITDKITKENQLAVMVEELKAVMKIEVMRYFGNMNMGDDTSWLDSYVDRMMKDEKQVEATYRRLLTDKVFNFILSKVNPVEKEVTAEELVGMQHHHQH